MPVEQRRLQDLVSIGPAMLRDLNLLGIRHVSELIDRKPVQMYRELCRFRP